MQPGDSVRNRRTGTKGVLKIDSGNGSVVVHQDDGAVATWPKDDTEVLAPEPPQSEHA